MRFLPLFLSLIRWRRTSDFMQNFDVCEPIDLEDIKQVLYFDIRLGFNDFGRIILLK